MKSEKGFATILLLTLAPVLVAGGLVVLFCFSFLKSDMAVLNICRAEQLQVQNQVGKTLTKLLALNPKARKLRASEKLARTKLQWALSIGNPYAVAAAEARLLQVQLQRQALALRQKALIQSANLRFSMAAPQLSRNLALEWRKHNAPLQPWMHSSLRIVSSKVPQLAVKPDFPDTAPVYEPVPHFEEAQSWAHSWQVKVQGKAWIKNFLNFKGGFQRSCATSLYAKNLDWIGKLKKARF